MKHWIRHASTLITKISPLLYQPQHLNLFKQKSRIFNSQKKKNKAQIILSRMEPKSMMTLVFNLKRKLEISSLCLLPKISHAITNLVMMRFDGMALQLRW